jgi:hypothetical protein
LWSKSCKLFEVKGRQCFQAFGTIGGEMQPDHAMVFFVSGSADKTGGVGTVDEADCAVMEKKQIVGHLSDGRASTIAVPPNGQQELVLGGRKPGGTRLALTPSFEMAESGAEGEQPGIDLIREGHSRHDIISSRWNFLNVTSCAQ